MCEFLSNLYFFSIYVRQAANEKYLHRLSLSFFFFSALFFVINTWGSSIITYLQTMISLDLIQRRYISHHNSIAKMIMRDVPSYITPGRLVMWITLYRFLHPFLYQLIYIRCCKYLLRTCLRIPLIWGRFID